MSDSPVYKSFEDRVKDELLLRMELSAPDGHKLGVELLIEESEMDPLAAKDEASRLCAAACTVLLNQMYDHLNPNKTVLDLMKEEFEASRAARAAQA